MEAPPLRAIVIGTGWAGEGHTLGLQAAGVEVVALAGRTPEPVRAKAAKLGVGAVCFDWRTALQEFTPDIVAIATTFTGSLSKPAHGALAHRSFPPGIGYRGKTGRPLGKPGDIGVTAVLSEPMTRFQPRHPPNAILG